MIEKIDKDLIKYRIDPNSNVILYISFGRYKRAYGELVRKYIYAKKIRPNKCEIEFEDGTIIKVIPDEEQCIKGLKFKEFHWI